MPINMKPTKKAPGAPAAGSHLDVAAVRELAEIAEAHGLSEIKFENADVLLVLRRGVAGVPAVVHAPPPMIHHVAAPAPAAPPPPKPQASEAKSTENGKYFTVASPFVGTFYRSPGPDAPPYVELGQRVKKGQVVCIVEAMKLMNEIEAELDGTVTQIMVENAQPVEYGQALLKIAP